MAIDWQLVLCQVVCNFGYKLIMGNPLFHTPVLSTYAYLCNRA
jgi:hypothetical protein